MKNKFNYFLSFILPFILCLLIFLVNGILGDIEEFFVCDLRGQHLSFFSYLKGVLLGTNSMFYSFYAGLGNPMFSTIIFYCTSPINLLLLLFKDIRYAILFIYMVKISLAGFSMFLLLKKKTGVNKLSTVIFSSCYALSGFVINYFFSILWFDSLYFAPLVMLGIEKMFDTRKINLLYILSLAGAIICNIQMGFGLCVYSVIYFLYSFNIRYDLKKEFKKFLSYGFIFFISSLCAGLISGGALIGFLADYGTTSIAREIKVTTSTGISNLLYVIKDLFTVGVVKDNYTNEFQPFIYCGLIVSFLSILYLFNKNIDKKKRVHSLFVILAFFAGFFIPFVNTFWHLNPPVMLNFRYSIYLGLFLTANAYECYLSYDKLLKKDIVILSILLFLGFTGILMFSKLTYVGWSFVLLIVIFSLLILTKNKSKKFEVLLFSTVLFEIVLNGYLSIYTASEMKFIKYASLDSFNELVSKKEFEQGYRVLYDYSYAEFNNDSLLFSKNSSPRYFSSIINGNVLNFFAHNSSEGGNNNYILSSNDSPLLLSLFGAKYFYLLEDASNSFYNKIDTFEIENYDYNEKTTKTKTVYLYENPYALSVGYVIENDAKYDENMSVADYHNTIIKSFSGIQNNVSIPLQFTSTSEDEYCLNSSFPFCKTYDIYNHTNNLNVYMHVLYDSYLVHGNAKAYTSFSRPLLMSSINKNVMVSLQSFTPLIDEETDIYTVDKNNFIKSLNSLKENMLYNINVSGNVMDGEINSSKDGILFLTLPYDDNYKIYIDDVEVDYFSVLDNSFIGLNISSGKHNVTIKYVDNIFKTYILVTCISLMITLVLYFIINKKVSKKIEAEEIEKRLIEEKKAINAANKLKNKKAKNKKRR
ncbi:MAG: YfhO family protein [Bacilli bacterium]|nr:YfhO family protein [Bacilli bacterium]